MVLEPWTIEASEEVEGWMNSLAENQKSKFEGFLALLAELGVLLPFPYGSQLRNELRELRIQFGRDKERVTDYPATGHRFILLTVFRKTQRRESTEIDRAERAMKGHKESGQ